MVVKVLGPLDTGTDALGARERTTLTALVVRRGSTVAPADLADAWWGETPPRTWEQQVRNAVARIRSRLGRESVETVGWQYRLGVDPDSIDAVRFERLVSSARGHALRGEHPRAIDAYGKALALWRGAPLQDVADWVPASQRPCVWTRSGRAPKRSGSTRGSPPVSTGRGSPTPSACCASSRCAKTAGRSSRSPTIAPTGRPRRSLCSAPHVSGSPTSSASNPAHG